MVTRHTSINGPSGLSISVKGVHAIVAVSPCGCVAAKAIVGTAGVSYGRRCKRPEHQAVPEGQMKVDAPVFPFVIYQGIKRRLAFIVSPTSFGLGLVKMRAAAAGVAEWALNVLCFTLTLQTRGTPPVSELDRILAELMRQARGEKRPSLPNFEDPKLEERIKSLPLRPN